MAKNIWKNPVFTLGGTSYTGEVAEATFSGEARPDETTCFSSNGYAEKEGTEKSAQLTLRIRPNSLLGAGTLHKFIRDNCGNNVAFEVASGQSPFSENNPKLTGTVVMTQLPFGGAANSRAEYSLTLPLSGAWTWVVA